MVQILWILEILTFNKALKIEYSIVYMATLLKFILEVDRKFEDTVTVIRPSQLENGFVYMATLIQLILAFQRKFEGTDPANIENIDVH
jgi:hypothetical protein